MPCRDNIVGLDFLCDDQQDSQFRLPLRRLPHRLQRRCVGNACPGLEVQVHIDIHVVISFGLEVFASIFGIAAIALEVFMKNSIANIINVVACVWCGFAFLRSLW